MSLLSFLATIIVVTASLGLLGLVVYTVEVKRKEISIRQIVGASISQVVFLLSKGFIFILLISALIALPISYFLSTVFLYNFANHIAVTAGQLFTCLGLLLTIGITTILSQTMRAASENPAVNLRSE